MSGPDRKGLYQSELQQLSKTYGEKKKDFAREREGSDLQKIGGILQNVLSTGASLIGGPLAGQAVNLAGNAIKAIAGPGEIDEEATRNQEEETLGRLKNQYAKTYDKLRDRTPEEKQQKQEEQDALFEKSKKLSVTPTEVSANAILKDQGNHSSSQVDWAKKVSQGATDRNRFRHKMADQYYDGPAEKSLIEQPATPWQ